MYLDELKMNLESSSASVISSSIFSRATPYCVFDDGSVTIGNEPFYDEVYKREYNHRTTVASSMSAAKSEIFDYDGRLDRWDENLTKMKFVTCTPSPSTSKHLTCDISLWTKQGMKSNVKRPYFKFEM